MKFVGNYLYQTDTNSCGPIASLNAEIWQGKDISKCDWSVLGPRRYLLNTRYYYRGTLCQNMSETLLNLNISNNMITGITIMKRELEQGNGLILLYSYKNQKIIPGCRINAHYIFVHKSNGRINVINDFNRKYFTKWETFKEYYLFDDDQDIYPRAWIIRKIDK